MKMTKKVLSVFLALAMIVGVFSMMTSALAPDSACDLYISADKEVYAPGDEIVLTISEQVEAEVGNMQIAGTYVIGYDSVAISPYSTAVDNLEDHGFSPIQAGYDSSISSLTETAGLDDTYNAAIAYNVCSDGFTDFDATSKTDLFTVKLKVNDDAPDGTYVIGFNTVSYSDDECIGYAVDSAMGGIYGSTPLYSTTANYSFGTCTIKVGAASAGPVVAKEKAQVKMTPNSATTVEDAFTFRVTSVITDADWDTYFANSADASATANAIQKVGFVAYKGTTGFSLETAKAVAQGTATEGYEVATTDYIQKVDDTSDAYFGCRLEITSAATRSDVTYVAFVEYLDASGNTAYAFYAAEEQALLNANYDTIVSTYLASYPFAG
ncbi:MAG: hypothetical protein ACI4K9_01700 [Candidatus Fimenecus sp.]